MNEAFVIKLVTPHLKEGKRLNESTFNKLFATLSHEQKISVRECLNRNGVAIGNERIQCKSKIEEQLIKEKRIKKSSYNPQSTLKNLTNEQLCVLYQRGNELALECLIENNQRLVWSRVNKYSGRYRHKLDEEDLIAFGNIGMMKAAKRFDVQHESKFSTYVIYWIDQMIMRSIADYGFTIRIPVHVFDDINRLYRIKRQHIELSREELFKLLHKEKGMTREKYEQLLIISENILSISSLNTLIGDGEETELSDFITNPEEQTVEDIVIQDALKETLERILEDFSYKERRIISLRFGLEDGVSRTLEEIGKEFGVTRERIRQIEVHILGKLRHPSRSKIIQDYITR